MQMAELELELEWQMQMAEVIGHRSVICAGNFSANRFNIHKLKWDLSPVPFISLNVAHFHHRHLQYYHPYPHQQENRQRREMSRAMR